jgi:hypothetical protein
LTPTEKGPLKGEIFLLEIGPVKYKNRELYADLKVVNKPY